MKLIFTDVYHNIICLQHNFYTESLLRKRLHFLCEGCNENGKITSHSSIPINMSFVRSLLPSFNCPFIHLSVWQVDEVVRAVVRSSNCSKVGHSIVRPVLRVQFPRQCNQQKSVQSGRAKKEASTEGNMSTKKYTFKLLIAML